MGQTGRRWSRAGAGVAVALLLLAGCGSSGSKASDTTSAPSGNAGGSTETTVSATLKVLVTNDDGYDADGIDAVVEGLRALPDTEVTVVAPLANQSGTGGKTTDGPLTVTDVKTKSGYPAKAVDGFPADTVIWAIDQHGIDFTPDLVVSGINFGQNIGPLGRHLRHRRRGSGRCGPQAPRAGLEPGHRRPDGLSHRRDPGAGLGGRAPGGAARRLRGQRRAAREHQHPDVPDRHEPRRDRRARSPRTSPAATRSRSTASPPPRTRSTTSPPSSPATSPSRPSARPPDRTCSRGATWGSRPDYRFGSGESRSGARRREVVSGKPTTPGSRWTRRLLSMPAIIT